jgi:hypothetical protein
LALRAVVGWEARVLVLGLALATALVATVWAVTVTAVLG